MFFFCRLGGATIADLVFFKSGGLPPSTQGTGLCILLALSLSTGGGFTCNASSSFLLAVTTGMSSRSWWKQFVLERYWLAVIMPPAHTVQLGWSLFFWRTWSGVIGWSFQRMDA